MPLSIAILVDTSTATPRREQAILAAVRRLASVLAAVTHVSTAVRMRVWSAREPNDDSLTPNSILDEATRREAQRLAFEAARELVDQARQHGEFGVLVSSNWDQLVSTLTDDFEFRAFALESVRRLRPTRAVVISASNQRAARCAEWLRHHGHPAFVVPVPSTNLGRRAPMQATAVAYEYDGGRCDVLFVPESAAMAASLEGVAACLSEHGGVAVGRARTIPSRFEPVGSRRRCEDMALRSALEALKHFEFPVDISKTTLAAELATFSQARHLLRKAAPKLLVIGNDRFVTGQLLVVAAHEQGCRVLCVQDGMAADVPGWWLRRADFTAANGVFFRDLLVRQGADPASVTVTGQPRYDTLLRDARQLDRATARTNLGVAGDLPVVLFALQDTHDERYVSAVMNALMSIPNVRVVIRPHPWHPGDAFRDLESAYATRISVARDCRLLDCLLAADVVVSQFSTLLVEAVVLGTPGIAISLSGSPDPIDLAKQRIVAGARDLDTFVAAVRRILTGGFDPSAARAEAERLIGPVDGLSSDRVVQLIVRLLKPS